ncbi:flagellin [bacterium (Candidatus Blackallbacteria) CG17_big_fil_post_rev_8_21_14_2_50_48_46]|uniref:Flagellin n=1 Tax=bacterium (Candidatus Blackallbacteria) CG17_big_fil_post_rev_8_21_14_2_50_48_46 TaxID=2014261 RepID=A0A2M7G2J9_9BACT|nr:MAG: flagellin [bacterium (Candidatus Blackallbacteria) CG18_big_fil_WC_8_21_14_2_50_49_26]PIW16020.1 MAG: flagellin [bacterium (Candidatus Blackallbacteria) CG17_big_fil_post_rev_8_21_14_2_50_48_46]PIW50432.1 MAG: flagellin [bacterium (Candidatus Blackallbacteria) CG13_big_fil_rev_8_21_14_2_50_49_14]
MAIRINSNIASLNAQRNLGLSNQQLNKTLERLSSGLRINRAADDAAGLAVSEKLRTQIKGFTQAIANSQDAVNLIATAESGIDQTSQILQRIRELSIQAAGDTLVNSDRSKIQEEINQLRVELTRIAETTEFNTRKLLDGSIAQATFAEDASASIKQNVRVGDTSVTVPVLNDFISSANVSVTGATLDTAFQIKFVSWQTNATSPVSVALEVRSSLDGVITTINLGATATNPTSINLTVSGTTIGSIAINASNISLNDIGKTALVQITARRAAVTTDQGLTFHVGANEGQFLKMGVQDLRGKALRLETINILGTNDEDSRVKAQNAIGAVDTALDYVNTVRSRLGAFQNRVEYTIQNLQVSRENLTASESRIRDADIAMETANLTRAQILVQAGTAVLTQANIAPQSALSLLGR